MLSLFSAICDVVCNAASMHIDPPCMDYASWVVNSVCGSHSSVCDSHPQISLLLCVIPTLDVIAATVHCM